MCQQLILHGSKLPEPRFAGLMDLPGLSSDALKPLTIIKFSILLLTRGSINAHIIIHIEFVSCKVNTALVGSS